MLELLASVLCFGLFLYKWLIIIAVLLTWVSADPYNPIVQWIARVTRPLWVWCEQRMPMMLAHFSPYAALLLVIFAQAVVPAELRSLNLLLEGQSDSNQILLQSGRHLLQGAAIVLQSLFFLLRDRARGLVFSDPGESCLQQPAGSDHSCFGRSVDYTDSALLA